MFSAAAPITRLGSRKIGEVSGSPPGFRTGDHLPLGELIVSGPMAVPEDLPAAVSLIDIAPTIASAFGIELKDVDGRAVPALAGQAVVRAKSA